jgi:hypothetical protein
MMFVSRSPAESRRKWNLNQKLPKAIVARRGSKPDRNTSSLYTIGFSVNEPALNDIFWLFFEFD